MAAHREVHVKSIEEAEGDDVLVHASGSEVLVRAWCTGAAPGSGANRPRQSTANGWSGAGRPRRS